MTGQQQLHYFHWGLSIVCHVYVTWKEYSGYILQEFVVFCLELPISIETLTYALPHQVDLCSLLHCLLDSHMLQKFDICESSSLARNNLGLSLEDDSSEELFCMVFKFCSVLFTQNPSSSPWLIVTPSHRHESKLRRLQVSKPRSMRIHFISLHSV